MSRWRGGEVGAGNTAGGDEPRSRRSSWCELRIETTFEGIDWVCSQLAPVLGRRRAVVALTRTVGESGYWDCVVQFGWRLDEETTGEIDDALAPLQRTALVGGWETRVLSRRPRPDLARLLPPHRVGRRIVLTQSTADSLEGPDDVVVRIAPSLTFGSGWHPATVATLALLERYAGPGLETLDLGCGS